MGCLQGDPDPSPRQVAGPQFGCGRLQEPETQDLPCGERVPGGDRLAMGLGKRPWFL